MELLLSGAVVEDIPQILSTYLFCSPALDRVFRCLPKSGGHGDQDHVDLLGFRIIEERIADFNRRKAEIEAAEEKAKEK